MDGDPPSGSSLPPRGGVGLREKLREFLFDLAQAAGARLCLRLVDGAAIFLVAEADVLVPEVCDLVSQVVEMFRDKWHRSRILRFWPSRWMK